MVRAGTLNRFVAITRAPITSGDSDGFFEPLSPSHAWCAIQPTESAVEDGTRLQYSRVTMRFHPQISVDTRLVYSDPIQGRDREFFVKSVQNVDDANVQLVLICEEPIP